MCGGQVAVEDRKVPYCRLAKAIWQLKLNYNNG